MRRREGMWLITNVEIADAGQVLREIEKTRAGQLHMKRLIVKEIGKSREEKERVVRTREGS